MPVPRQVALLPRRGEPARMGCRLEDGDVVAALAQPLRDRQPEEPGADHGRVSHRCAVAIGESCVRHALARPRSWRIRFVVSLTAGQGTQRLRYRPGTAGLRRPTGTITAPPGPMGARQTTERVSVALADIRWTPP